MNTIKFNIYTQCDHCKKNAACHVGNAFTCEKCYKSKMFVDFLISLEDIEKMP